MTVGLWEFLTIMIMTFALFLLIVGIFTVYFGSGKSRKIGAGLTVGGIVLGFLWILFTTDLFMDPLLGDMLPQGFWLSHIIVQSILVIIAAALGALVALGIFLLAIMKS